MKLEQLREVQGTSFEALEESFNEFVDKYPLEEAWFRFNDDEKSLIKRVWTAIKERNIGALWDGEITDLKYKNGVYTVDRFFKAQTKANIGLSLRLIHNMVMSIGIIAISLAVAVGGAMMMSGAGFWAFNAFIAAAGGGSFASTLASLGLGSALAAISYDLNLKTAEYVTEELPKIIAPEILKVYSDFGEFQRVILRALRRIKQKFSGVGKAAGIIKRYEPKKGWEDKYDSTRTIDYEPVT